MPSIFTHAFAAIAIGNTLGKRPFQLLIIGAICSVLPDADVISFALGIPYEHVFGHRGITHSFFFSLVVSLVMVFLFFRSWKMFSLHWIGAVLFLFVSTVSHAILDAMTSGGLGVAFFAPFDNTRYFFPWRPIKVSPIGAAGFFSEKGWKVFESELLWVWLPLSGTWLLSTLGVYALRKK